MDLLQTHLAPRVFQVRARTIEEGIRTHFYNHLEREDVEVDPLTHVDKCSLLRAGRIEGRLPRHGHAVAQDGEEN